MVRIGSIRSKDVDSSMIKRVTHAEADNRLYVEFHDGSVYEFQNAPIKLFRAIIRAKSKGKYFHHNIRPVYPYRKVLAKDVPSSGNVTGATTKIKAMRRRSK